MRYLLLLLFLPGLLSAQRIILDEDYSDWQNTPVAYADPVGDGGFDGIDFGQAWISNDADFLFLRFEVGKEINLQDNNAIVMYLDTDNDPTTGFIVEGIGAEIKYEFGNRLGQVIVSNHTINVDHFDIGLVASPTVSSNQFELAVARDLSFFDEQVFQGTKVKVVLKSESSNGDVVPDISGGVAYTFDDTGSDPLPDFSIQQALNSQLRIMSYNVLRDNLFENFLQNPYRRIFEATQPQIIGFQEIYDHTSGQTADKVNSYLPLATDQQWYHAKVNPDIIAVSRYPIIGTHGIRDPFGETKNGAFLIDLDPDSNTKMLFIVAHPPCCDNNFERQQEVDAIMAFIRETKEGNGPFDISTDDPIVIVGDMNLVGFKEQQQTLITGNIGDEVTYGEDFNPDWDDTALEDAKPITTNMPMTFTWYDEGSSFSPGRLDYIIYSGSVMSLRNAYSLFTPALTNAELSDNGLNQDDVILTSDHLPLIADFDFSFSLPVVNVAEKPSISMQVFPNPFAEATQLLVELPQSSPIEIELYDILGQRIAQLYKGTMSAGSNTIEISNHHFATGIYICRMKGDFGMISRKLEVLN